MMLSIKINQTISTIVDDSTSTPEPQTTMEGTKITTIPKESTPRSKVTIIIDNNFDDTTTNSESQSTFMSRKGTTATPTDTKVPETSTKAQTQVAIITGGVLCALVVMILLVVLVITVFVMLRCRNHTKGFSPNTIDLKTLPPVLDNPTYSLVDGES